MLRKAFTKKGGKPFARASAKKDPAYTPSRFEAWFNVADRAEVDEAAEWSTNDWRTMYARAGV